MQPVPIIILEAGCLLPFSNTIVNVYSKFDNGNTSKVTRGRGHRLNPRECDSAARRGDACHGVRGRSFARSRSCIEPCRGLANRRKDDRHSDDVERETETRGNGERRRDVSLVRRCVKGLRRRRRRRHHRDFKGTIERRYRAGSRF